MGASIHDTATAGDWSRGSMLFLGTFGTGRAGGRTAGIRARMGLLALLVAMVAYHLWAPAGAAMIVASVAFLVWSHVSYWRGLDELERNIQQQALAWTYGGLAVVAFLGYWLLPPSVGLPSGLLLVIAGELMRGPVLVLVASRYQ